MTYNNYIWKSNRSLVIFSVVFISLFQFLILYLVTTFDTQLMISSILNQMPEKMKVLLGESFFSTLTFDGAAAFGYNHPMVLVMMALVAVTLPVKHVSREISQGTMELLLSYPVSRSALILRLWLAGTLILAAIAVASFAASVLATEIFHNLKPEAVIRILMISANLWLLFVLVMSYILLFAVWGRGGGSSGSTGAMVTLFFYLMLFFGQLWETLEFTLPFNIFNYYQPQEIMFGRGTMLADSALLAILSLLMLAGSVYGFNRRDVP